MQAAEFGGQLGRSKGKPGLIEPAAVTEFIDPELGQRRALLERVSLIERGLMSNPSVQELDLIAKGRVGAGERCWSWDGSAMGIRGGHPGKEIDGEEWGSKGEDVVRGSLQRSLKLTLLQFM